MTFEDLLADGTLTMENYDRLIEAIRGANQAIDSMRELTESLRAERRLRDMELRLGIPVPARTHAFLAVRHASLVEALA